MISTTNSKLKVTDLNPFLICVLCKGYFVDATTIVECLHSFCKTCIVKYLKRHKYCPICDVLVYKNKPLQNIRADEKLQNVVYKLIPGLYAREMQRRQTYYSSISDQNTSDLTPEKKGIITEDTEIILPDENISIALEYLALDSDVNKGLYGRRYLKCKASAHVSILHKFLKNKFSLSNKHSVEIICNNEVVTEDLSIADLAYIYQWKKKSHMYLAYRILEAKIKRTCLKEEIENFKRLKLSENSVPTFCDDAHSTTTSTHNHSSNNNVNKTIPTTLSIDKVENFASVSSHTIENLTKQENSNEWKEVELKINDNGEMSATVVNNQLSAPSKTNVDIFASEEQSSTTPSNNYVVISTIAQNAIKLPTYQNVVGTISSATAAVTTTTMSLTNKTISSPIIQTQDLPSFHPNKDSISPTIFGNRALVHPMVQENKNSTPMNFTNPNLKIPPVPPPGYVQRNSRPRASSNVPKYKTMKPGIRQFNVEVPRNKTPISSSDYLKVQESMPKIYKPRNSSPRFAGNPTNVTKSPYQLMSLQDIHRPRTSSPSVTKVDPKTLNPIVSVSSASNLKSAESPTYMSNSPPSPHLSGDKQNLGRHSQIKDLNPFLHPGFFYPGFLPYPVDNNPLLPNTPPDFMKAMSALYQQNSAFHSSLPPSISTLFNHHAPPSRPPLNDKKSCPTSLSLSPSRSQAQPMSPSRSHISIMPSSQPHPLSPSKSGVHSISTSRSQTLPNTAPKAFPTSINSLGSLSEVPKSSLSGIYLPPSLSVVSSNSNHPIAPPKPYVPLVSISNSKSSSPSSKAYSLVKTVSSYTTVPSIISSLPSNVNKPPGGNIFSPANMVNQSSRTYFPTLNSMIRSPSVRNPHIANLVKSNHTSTPSKEAISTSPSVTSQNTVLSTQSFPLNVSSAQSNSVKSTVSLATQPSSVSTTITSTVSSKTDSPPKGPIITKTQNNSTNDTSSPKLNQQPSSQSKEPSHTLPRSFSPVTNSTKHDETSPVINKSNDVIAPEIKTQTIEKEKDVSSNKTKSKVENHLNEPLTNGENNNNVKLTSLTN